MSGFLQLRASAQGEVAAVVGPRLLAGIGSGPGLYEHRATWPAPRALDEAQLLALLEAVPVHGRGGAGFPFARKVRTAIAPAGAGPSSSTPARASRPAPRTPSCSSPRRTSCSTAPRPSRWRSAPTRARGRRARPPAARLALEDALAERDATPRPAPRVEVHATRSGFVGGQETRRPGAPRRPREPPGHRLAAGCRRRACAAAPPCSPTPRRSRRSRRCSRSGRPAYAELGTRRSRGPRCSPWPATVPHGVVLEVPFGVGLGQVLEYCGYAREAAMLLGGYHGTWLPPGHGAAAARQPAAAAARRPHAGCRVSCCRWTPGTCPVVVTAGVTGYLAGRPPAGAGPASTACPHSPTRSAALADGVGPRSHPPGGRT